MSPSFVGEHRQLLRAAAALTLLLLLAGCGNREKAVSGTMPWIFYAFGALFPTTYFIALMRAIILRGANFFEYWPNLAILIVMSALLFAFCASRFRTKIA